MKQTLIRSLQVCALLIALAITSSAEESKRGLYEGNLAGGGRIVFFLQGNHAISSYVFDTAGHQASFAGGTVADNGTFTLTTSSDNTISGTVNPGFVVASVLGQTVTANRVRPFGESEHFGGRFTATARSTSSTATYDVKIVLDAQKNIFFIAKQGPTVLGGFGAITLAPNTSPSPSPSASPSPGISPSPSPSPGTSPSPSPSPSPTGHPRFEIDPSSSGSHGGHGGHGDDDGDAENHHHGHDFESDDEQEDHDLDDNSHSFSATFSLTLVTGEAVTGHLTFSEGFLLGDFTLNGETFGFRAAHESAQHHLANISTRGFVNTGQGQLIGGFIIRSGPKMVIIRALGPSLSAAGISPILADPQVQLFQNQTLIAQNDNWQSASNLNDLLATTIPPTDPNEAAILIRLEPGNYTTVVSGVDNGTGISLVEVYEIDRD
jgi:hypothetical protein